MNDDQLGTLLRAVRKRSLLLQSEVADRSEVAHSTISLVERGHWDKLSIQRLRQIAAVLDIRLELTAHWRGGDALRLLNWRHSLLAASFAAFMGRQPGWVSLPEVSFSIYGERGVIDSLAWHEADAHLLVVELKTDFVDVNETIGQFDRYVRLARQIAVERGWRPRTVSGWLVVLDTSVNRRCAAEHKELLKCRFRADGHAMRTFLREPSAETIGLSFWSDSNRGGTKWQSAPQRVRIRAGEPR